MKNIELIVGPHAVMAALRYEPDRLHGIWVERQRRDRRLGNLLEEAERRGIPIRLGTRMELDRISGGAYHQGVIAHGIATPMRNERDLTAILDAVEGPPLLLALDGLQDPHNLGACLRTADGAGVHAVMAPIDRAVGLTATVRKVACGAAQTVPFIQVTNLARSLRALQDRGIGVIGAASEAEISLYKVDFTAPVAIVLGAEGKGLRRLTREVCDSLVHIPMAGTVESLNVSVATGVLLFEAIRQRRGSF